MCGRSEVAGARGGGQGSGTCCQHWEHKRKQHAHSQHARTAAHACSAWPLTSASLVPAGVSSCTAPGGSSPEAKPTSWLHMPTAPWRWKQSRSTLSTCSRAAICGQPEGRRTRRVHNCKHPGQRMEKGPRAGPAPPPTAAPPVPTCLHRHRRAGRLEGCPRTAVCALQREDRIQHLFVHGRVVRQAAQQVCQLLIQHLLWGEGWGGGAGGEGGGEGPAAVSAARR